MSTDVKNAENNTDRLRNNLTTISSIKSGIKNAIRSKDVPVSDDEPFTNYANKISQIETGIDTSDATAIATDIKSGKTAYVDGVKVTGTLPEVINPATISSIESYNGSFFKPDDAVVGINKYGSYLVTDNIGSHIGTEYLVNWVKVTDSQTWFIKNQQKVKVGMPVNTIASVGGLSPNIIKNGVTVLGVTGTYGSSTDYPLPNGIKFIQSTISSFPNDIDTSNVTDMSNMFTNCTNLTTIPALNTSNVTNMSSMFNSCSSLKTISLLDTSGVTDMSNMFTKCKNLETIPALNTSNVTNMSNMFNSCSNLTTVPVLDTSSVTNMNYMFQNCSNLTTIPALNTSNVTTMRNMFQSCSNLTTIPALNTSNVTNMFQMFTGCKNLETVPTLNTSSVTNINSMFNSCSSLSDTSLNNILAMCINATSYMGTKKLSQLGFNQNTYPASRIQALSNYQDFIDAGWTIGY